MKVHEYVRTFPAGNLCNNPRLPCVERSWFVTAIGIIFPAEAVVTIQIATIIFGFVLIMVMIMIIKITVVKYIMRMRIRSGPFTQ